MGVCLSSSLVGQEVWISNPGRRSTDGEDVFGRTARHQDRRTRRRQRQGIKLGPWGLWILPSYKTPCLPSWARSCSLVGSIIVRCGAKHTTRGSGDRFVSRSCRQIQYQHYHSSTIRLSARVSSITKTFHAFRRIPCPVPFWSRAEDASSHEGAASAARGQSACSPGMLG